MVHPDVISVQSMLKNAGFDVPEINMDAYMKARAMTQEFIDEWLGYFINPKNKISSSLLLECGLPGGMMGSMMADLGGIHTTINNLVRRRANQTIVRRPISEALRRSSIRLASCRLSSIGNTVLSIH